MIETIKETLQAYNDRIKSPFIGSMALVFIATNWKAIFYLLFAEQPVIVRFAFVDSTTSSTTLLWWPVIGGVLLTLLLPWLRLLGAYAVRKPLTLLSNLQFSEIQKRKVHELNQEAALIEAQTNRDAVAERAQIQKAKTLQEAEEIGGEELKQELQTSRTSADLANEKLSAIEESMLGEMASQPEGDFEFGKDSNGRFYFKAGNKREHLQDREKYLNVEHAFNRLAGIGLIAKAQSNSGFLTKTAYDFLRNRQIKDTLMESLFNTHES